MTQEKLWISVDSDWLVIPDSEMRLLGDVAVADVGDCPSCGLVDVMVVGMASRETGVVPVWCPGCGWRDF